MSVGLVLLCLGLAGCGILHKNKNENNGKPFKGLPTTQDPIPGPGGATTTSREPGVPPRVDGFLAGQVVNKSSNRRLTHAYIQVIDLQNPRPNEATNLAETDQDGYFAIRGLQKGRHYQLIARVQDGSQVFAGAELVSPPNPKVCIMVTEDPTGGKDPFVGRPELPGQQPLPSNGPPAELGRPQRPPATLAPPDSAVPHTSAPPQPPLDRSRIVDGARDGFPRAIPADVPGPPLVPGPPPLPPPPTYQPAPPVSTGPVSVMPMSGQVDPSVGQLARLSDEPLRVPTCQLIGYRLENMALSTLDGQAWEFKRHHKGKLVLLDFWSTTCPPCLKAIPHLCDLQGAYGRYGLEVVGIAYESGPIPEQAQKVRSTRGRMLMNYPTLLGGGGRGPCPVQSQFQVTFFPALVLLDDKGNICWRSGPEGLTAEKLRELKQEVSMRLRVQMPGYP
jgi:thiol-disulfide isomerase/thioredoxin